MAQHIKPIVIVVHGMLANFVFFFFSAIFFWGGSLCLLFSLNSINAYVNLLYVVIVSVLRRSDIGHGEMD